MLYPLSASYNPTLNGIVLKLYNDKTEDIEEWIDVDFKPYFLTKTEPHINWKSLIKKEVVKKYDALIDDEIEMWKVTLENPLAIRNSHKIDDAYENHINFFQSFIYDNDIKMGMPYLKENGKLVFQVDQDAQYRIKEILSKFKNLSPEEYEMFERWARLLEYPAPNFKRVSLDIEVYNESENQIPNAETALLPVLMACFASNRGERMALVLLQENKEFTKLPDNVDKVVWFTDEKELIKTIFNEMNKYPIIITFNGDDFDFKYLYYRALRLGIPDGMIPINVHKRMCSLRRGFHIDLYKFFSINAMRVYAFKAKYKNKDLDSVATALIKKGKIKHEKGRLSEMTYYDLIKYCMNDAEITLELTTYNNDLVMNLIIILERMSRMPIENVTRKSVSSWIKSFILFEHRQHNIIIPNPEDIKMMKGETVSKAVIKGKKYKGAIVFDPVTGTHFKVSVLDFASLYPSIFKIYNIGYSTIRCTHEECKSNTVGELPHWICTKHKSLESLLIGSLRDLRVLWYKHAGDNLKDEKLKNWYSVNEQAIKVILNASYGVFGADSFMFYCPSVSEEITAIGRHIIKKTAEHATQKLGVEVLYGDTDSIFVKNPPKEKLDELIKWTQSKYDIEFEIDKTYRYVCLSDRKKNYFGVLEDGEVDVKGLTGKKKHTPKIIKNVFNETKKVLSEIETPEQMEIGKQKIIELIKNAYFMFKNRSWKNIEDLAFHVTINKELEEYTKTTPQHVKAARLLTEKGYQVGVGSVISFIKTNKKISGITVKPVETTKTRDVDITKYIEFLKSTFEQILDPLDLSFDEDVIGITKISQWIKN